MQTATRVFLFAIVVALAIVLARFSIVIDG